MGLILLGRFMENFKMYYVVKNPANNKERIVDRDGLNKLLENKTILQYMTTKGLTKVGKAFKLSKLVYIKNKTDVNVGKSLGGSKSTNTSIKSNKFIVYSSSEIVEKTSKSAELPMRDITKDALSSILKDKDSIYILRGMRRTGKTTALYQIANYLAKRDFIVGYISLKYLSREKIYYTELESLVTKSFSNYDYLFIDEYSFLEDGLEHLRNLYDSLKGVKIVITGSDSLALVEPLLCKENTFRVSYSNLSRVSYKELHTLIGINSIKDYRVYYGIMADVPDSGKDKISVGKTWLDLSIISNIANSIRKSVSLQNKYKNISNVISSSEDNSLLEAGVYDVLILITLKRGITKSNQSNYLQKLSLSDKDVMKNILGIDNLEYYFGYSQKEGLKRDIFKVLCSLGVLEPIDCYTNTMDSGDIEIEYTITLPYIYDIILSACKFVLKDAEEDLSVVGSYLENLIISNVIILHPEYRVAVAKYKGSNIGSFELDMIIQKDNKKSLFYEIKNTDKTEKHINYVDKKDLLNKFSNTEYEAFVLYNGVGVIRRFPKYNHILKYINISEFLLSL